MKRMICVAIAVCGLVAVSAELAEAALVVPSVATADSELFEANEAGKAIQLIAGGVVPPMCNSDAQRVVYDGPVSTWDAKSGDGTAAHRNWYQWRTNGTQTATVTFTLPYQSTVNTAYLWNYNNQGGGLDYTDQGVRAFTIWTSTDGTMYNQVSSASLSELAKTVYSNSYTATTPTQTVTFDPVSAKYVQIRTTSNWGSTTNNTGLSKVLFGGSTPAPGIISAVSATASSTFGGGPNAASRLIDWGAMTVTGTDPAAWTHANSAGGAHSWMMAAGNVNDQWVKFDLGGLMNLTKTYIWNFAQNGLPSRGVHNFEIWGSADDVTYQLLTATATVDLTQPVNNSPATTQSFDLINASSIRYVRLDLNTSWGDAYAGLGQVVFQGAPVPEPGTMALLAAGLAGLLCYAWRKRK